MSLYFFCLSLRAFFKTHSSDNQHSASLAYSGPYIAPILFAMLFYAVLLVARTAHYVELLGSDTARLFSLRTMLLAFVSFPSPLFDTLAASTFSALPFSYFILF